MTVPRARRPVRPDAAISRRVMCFRSLASLMRHAAPTVVATINPLGNAKLDGGPVPIGAVFGITPELHDRSQCLFHFPQPA